MFHKILLATDGSEHSLHAAEKAIGLAKLDSNSHIEIIYVVDEDAIKSDVLQNWNSMGTQDLRMEKVKQAENKVKTAGISYEVKILHGEPGPALVDYANQNEFDVVVIGSRGLNSLQEFVLGSVSHKVAKRANCPVLIVKPPVK